MFWFQNKTYINLKNIFVTSEDIHEIIMFIWVINLLLVWQPNLHICLDLVLFDTVFLF